MPDRQWLARNRRILMWSGAAFVVVAVVTLTRVDHGCNLTGFGACAIPENTRPEKTLWDWFQLLVVPAVLAGAGLWFSHIQKRTELEIADQQKRTELEIAEQRTQDAILQTYFDQITQLLLHSDPMQIGTVKVVCDMARVRTLAALRRLDAERRNLLIQFLRDAALVKTNTSNSLIDLERADLSGADLRSTKFTYLYLQRAKFHTAQLQKADLEGAQLQHANFINARLEGANFIDARLEGAAFINAWLDNANFKWSDITSEQLAQAASYKGATLPDHLLNSAHLQVPTAEQPPTRLSQP